MNIEMIRNKTHPLLYVLITALIIFTSINTQAQVQYSGVNLAGADFGFNNLPGVYGTDYTYPTHAEVDYFTRKGMNIFRLPFRWERLQPSKNGDLNAAELARIDDFVNYATSKQAQVILDPHNYSRYYGEIVGSPQLSVSVFEDFWSKLANHYKNNDRVILGLMNEPYGMATELWLSNANAAISAIRTTGAVNLILIPGNAYTGAHSWNADWYGTSNGEVMQNVIDPTNNYAYDVHQYLDTDSSGTSQNCVNASIGSTRLQEFTSWLRQHNQRGFLGEFAGGVNTNCLNALNDMLEFMDANADVWLGWTYWAAGPWWVDYMYTLEPEEDETDRPQMAILLEHIPSCDSSAASLDIPTGQWQQISLPCTPSSNAQTVQAIFADDLNGSYGSDWVVYSYDPVHNTYINPGLNGILMQGMGYWVIHNNGSMAVLDLPSGSTQTSVAHTDQCVNVKGCYSIPLKTISGYARWNMLGHPFLNSVTLDRLRVITNGEPCASGCTLDEAQSENIIENKLWHYHDTSYSVIEGDAQLHPWNGFWIAVLAGASSLNPRLEILMD